MVRVRHFFFGLSIVATAFVAACGGSASDDGSGATEQHVGTSAPASDGGVCGAWDARSEGFCRMILGRVWDGTSCVQISGCSCVGADCDKVAADACEGVATSCSTPTGSATNLCDERRVACRMAKPRCPAGQTPAVVVAADDPDGAGCWGDCVEITSCKCDPAQGSKDCPADHACWGTHLACGPLVR